MTKKTKALIIAGESSGVGKTTISLGIMGALTKRDKKVAPFKVGPDYIDPGFHKFVTGNPSYNLDSWLLKEKTLKYLFNKNIKNKDMAIIEGVMGLYDGFGIEKDEGSTAHMSKILDAPVILIIDGKGMSSSAAAKVLGYKMYDEDVNIAGVIINRVSGEKHYNILKEVIERDVKIPCIGYLPSNLDISLNSRHLGLIPAEEIDDLRNRIDKISELVEAYIDLDTMENLAYNKTVENMEYPLYRELKDSKKGLKIGIAKDKAFSFYYQDNIDLLKEMGIELVPFSPLKDKDIPKGVDGLYIGGGFPEVFAKGLEKNEEFRKNLKNHLENGLPAYGECGGLMYLTEGIEDLDGNYHNMVGFLPTKGIMTKRLQRFGYVNININDDTDIKAHEFHRSKIIDNDKLDYIYDVKKVRNGQVKNQWKCGVIKKNVLAGYGHIHFYSNIEFLKWKLNLKKKE